MYNKNFQIYWAYTQQSRDSVHVDVGTFEQSEVVALLSRDSLSDRVTGVDMSARTSIARAAAAWNESEIVVGWIPTIIITDNAVFISRFHSRGGKFSGLGAGRGEGGSTPEINPEIHIYKLVIIWSQCHQY